MHPALFPGKEKYKKTLPKKKKKKKKTDQKSPTGFTNVNVVCYELNFKKLKLAPLEAVFA